jgi:hypothetical protein
MPPSKIIVGCDMVDCLNVESLYSATLRDLNFSETKANENLGEHSTNKTEYSNIVGSDLIVSVFFLQYGWLL